MVANLIQWFRCIFIIFIVIISVNHFSYAATNISENEKQVFAIAGNLGETSFLISDILSNSNMMGIAILHKKMESLKSLATAQPYFIKKLNMPNKIEHMARKFKQELDAAYAAGELDSKKFMKAKETFDQYSQQVRNEVEKLYGPKYAWLFNTGILASFTNLSMRSEYKNKLVLLQFRYLLDYIPYDLPTSVISSLSSIATIKEAELTPDEVVFLKEASRNVIGYFTNPEAYTPPATISNLVGTWEGRLSDPNGQYHKATLTIEPDLTALISAEDMFENMPVKRLSMTQSIVNFEIAPFAQEELTIKFTGRIVDDMLAGEAVDISGKKGKWQLLKTTKTNFTEIIPATIENDPTVLEDMIGVWKGKILEEAGAISSATLYFNLQEDSYIEVFSDETKKSLKIKDVAVNDEAVTFRIVPNQTKDLQIIFAGKINGRILEGNATASDGSRGYWKLVKVVNTEAINDREPCPLPSQSGMLYEDLCDPIIRDEIYENLILVSKKSVIVPKTEVHEGIYQGYIVFNDGSKANLILTLSNDKSRLALANPDDEGSRLDLRLTGLSITDRMIKFNANFGENKDSEVLFKGKIFGDYISGKAINAYGNELNWELIAVEKAKTILENVKSSEFSQIKGTWIGKASFGSLLEESVNVMIDEETRKFQIGEREPCEIRSIILDGDSLSFIVPESKENSSQYVFNGTIKEKTIKGKLTNIEGLGLSMYLELLEPCVIDKDVSGIWQGRLYSGNTSADIVMDFTTCEKKVFVDDPKAKSGRVELVVKDFSETDKVVKFKAMTTKSPVPVEFIGYKDKEEINGSAMSALKDAKKLSWSVNKSDLIEYIPEDIDHVTTEPEQEQNNFSFIEELKEKDNKIHDSKTLGAKKKKTERFIEVADASNGPVEENIKPCNQMIEDSSNLDDQSIESKESLNPGMNEADKETTTDKAEKKVQDESLEVKKELNPGEQEPVVKEEKAVKKLENVEEQIKKEPETVEITDETLFNQKEIEKARQELKKLEDQVEKTTVKTEKQPDEIESRQEEKTKVTDPLIKSNEEETDINLPETSKMHEDEPANVKSADETSSQQVEENISMNTFYGSWTGELINPDQAKGSITLQIGEEDSYLFVTNEGEKVSFKLFDLEMNGKDISFNLKPAQDTDYVITFNGALIEGVLSGSAEDPSGKKGKWFVNKELAQPEEKNQE